MCAYAHPPTHTHTHHTYTYMHTHTSTHTLTHVHACTRTHTILATQSISLNQSSTGPCELEKNAPSRPGKTLALLRGLRMSNMSVSRTRNLGRLCWNEGEIRGYGVTNMNRHLGDRIITALKNFLQQMKGIRREKTNWL